MIQNLFYFLIKAFYFRANSLCNANALDTIITNINNTIHSVSYSKPSTINITNCEICANSNSCLNCQTPYYLKSNRL